MTMKAAVRIIALLLFAGFGAAGATPEHVTSPNTAQVKQVIDDFFAAAQRRDWDAAGKLLSADFKIYTDGVGIHDRPEYVALLKEDDIVTLSLDIRDMDISVSHDGQMAWARYRAFIQSESKGIRSNTKTAETIVFERIGGDWRIRHTHVSYTESKDEQP
jgi:ketosteroid isomerase-like protein